MTSSPTQTSHRTALHGSEGREARASEISSSANQPEFHRQHLNTVSTANTARLAPAGAPGPAIPWVPKVTARKPVMAGPPSATIRRASYHGANAPIPATQKTARVQQPACSSHQAWRSARGEAWRACFRKAVSCEEARWSRTRRRASRRLRRLPKAKWQARLTCSRAWRLWSARTARWLFALAAVDASWLACRAFS